MLLRALCGSLTLLCTTGLLSAQSIWNTTTGSWFTSTHWSPTGVPTDASDIQVNNGGTAQISASGAVSYEALLGNLASGNGTVEVLGNGAWSTAILTVGVAGTGKLLISGTGQVISSGSFVAFDENSTGTVEVSGGKWTSNNALFIGYRGTGSLEISGTGVVVAQAGLHMAVFSTGSGTLTLRGDATSRGVLITPFVNEMNNMGGKVIFDGGVLRASSSSADFIANFEAGDVQIRNGGAYIDTNGFNPIIHAVLQDAPGQLGYLVKQGVGTLTLVGVNTFLGGTTVREGTLTLGDGVNPAALES
ncbi:MAG TPA: autotransporter-associated beta strand repeat-containing protein, partial [Verrucomicrobium sp.]|nr:autotransporter-associated beta strand repeat-containing protein [Verrucomicrobium sp.]